MWLFLHELQHLILALLIGLFFYKKYKNPKSFWAVILITFAIDGDHLVDYFLYYGAHFNLEEFLSGVYFDLSGKVIVPLHGWELVPIAGFLGKKTKTEYLLYPLALGMAGHLIFDQITYTSNPLGYFLIPRALNHFDQTWFTQIPF